MRMNQKSKGTNTIMINRIEAENYKGFAKRFVWDLAARAFSINRNLVQNSIYKTLLGLALI